MPNLNESLAGGRILLEPQRRLNHSSCNADLNVRPQAGPSLDVSLGLSRSLSSTFIVPSLGLSVSLSYSSAFTIVRSQYVCRHWQDPTSA